MSCRLNPYSKPEVLSPEIVTLVMFSVNIPPLMITLPKFLITIGSPSFALRFLMVMLPYVPPLITINFLPNTAALVPSITKFPLPLPSS